MAATGAANRTPTMPLISSPANSTNSTSTSCRPSAAPTNLGYKILEPTSLTKTNQTITAMAASVVLWPKCVGPTSAAIRAGTAPM